MVGLGYVAAHVAEQEKRKPIELDLTDPPNECVSVPRDKRLGLLLRRVPQWWLTQPAFGATPASGWTRALRRVLRRHLARSPRAGRGPAPRGRQGVHRQPVRARRGGGPAGHRTGQGDGRQPHLLARPVPQRPHTDPARRTGATGNYPNTVNLLLGGGDMAGYQAGSTFKMFAMLAALEPGLPLSTAIYAPHRYPPATTASGPSAAAAALVPVERQRVDDRAPDHVERVRQVGEHLLRPARAAGRRRVRGAHGRAARPALAHRHRPDDGRPGPGDGGARSPWGWPTPRRWRWPDAYATVAADGMYCEPLPVLSITGPDGSAR